jgi:hypothetical protein
LQKITMLKEKLLAGQVFWCQEKKLDDQWHHDGLDHGCLEPNTTLTSQQA